MHGYARACEHLCGPGHMHASFCLAFAEPLECGGWCSPPALEVAGSCLSGCRFRVSSLFRDSRLLCAGPSHLHVCCAPLWRPVSFLFMPQFCCFLLPPSQDSLTLAFDVLAFLLSHPVHAQRKVLYFSFWSFPLSFPFQLFIFLFSFVSLSTFKM